MGRIGKIGRLDVSIRNEVNERLADGEPGKSIVAWLNGHPDVQEMLALYFDGKPITEQSLSEWRKRGYQDWQRHQEDLEFAGILADEAAELEEDREGMPLSDRIAPVAALALARLLRRLGSAKKPAERRELLACVEALQRQRLADQQAARLRMDLRRWREEEAELDEKSTRRQLWKQIKFHELVESREDWIRFRTRNLPPERAEALRRYFDPCSKYERGERGGPPGGPPASHQAAANGVSGREPPSEESE
ncbi:MAG TPA: hypothetical protein VG796_12210 [Verrucomicrobiales bacterium]|nr:hypothetical protein [Verrucomicrobiales bacterium]